MTVQNGRRRPVIRAGTLLTCASVLLAACGDARTSTSSVDGLRESVSSTVTKVVLTPVNPIVAVLLGNWLAAEPLEPRIWLAATLIVGSVMFINRSRPNAKKEAKSEAEEVAVIGE